MSRIQIELDTPTRIFRSGDTVSGKVHCYFRNDKNIKGIRLKLLGKEHTHWKKTENVNNKHKVVNYTGDNKFFYYELRLAPEGKIDSGAYDYPFSYILPNNIPSSFTCQSGSIEYGVEAMIEMPHKNDYKAVTKFTVLTPITFSEHQIPLLVPVQWSEQKSLWCVWCRSGPIILDLYLNKSAFVVGEAINARVECKNMSGIDISKLNLELYRKITSKVKLPIEDRKGKTEVVARKFEGGVDSLGEQTYDIDLLIPASCSVHNLESSELFMEEWGIKVTAVLKGWHSNIETGGSIVLGHVPYDPGHTRLASSEQDFEVIEMESLPNPPTSSTHISGVHAEHLPPSYEEATAPSAPVAPRMKY